MNARSGTQNGAIVAVKVLNHQGDNIDMNVPMKADALNGRVAHPNIVSVVPNVIFNMCASLASASTLHSVLLVCVLVLG